MSVRGFESHTRNQATTCHKRIKKEVINTTAVTTMWTIASEFVTGLFGTCGDVLEKIIEEPVLAAFAIGIPVTALAVKLIRGFIGRKKNVA